jgi:protein-L-isoaspartate(D-aspartate) O-methyltransferase
LSRHRGARYNGLVSSREDLVRTLIAQGIRDERVLDAVRAIRREAFVPPASRRCAYADVPLPIPHGQVTTQPSLSARMIEGLALAGEERVLEIGTGHGFQTALLATLAREVWSVERWQDLADTARANLRRRGLDNVSVVVGDGTLGLPEAAPFDAILVSAAFPRVPGPLAAQLVTGGRLVQPIGPGGREDVILFVAAGGELHREELVTRAHFVRLVGAHGYGDA